MIHYHGTPCGGPRQDAARFLRGRHALVPHAHRADIGAVSEFCASFVLDNSAFTAWRGGKAVDVPAYAAWCETWHRHPGFDWCLIPDVIDGTEAENDALLHDWPRHLRGVPVWHLHESLERLRDLVTAWPTVALGSSGQWPTPGTEGWWDRLAEAMAVACDDEGRPLCRLHGLRMLIPAIFTRLPLSSADSTNATMNSGSLARFGTYLPATTAQRAAVIADRIEGFNSAPLWSPRNVTVDLFA
jgi:hypothetical protein